LAYSYTETFCYHLSTFLLYSGRTPLGFENRERIFCSFQLKNSNFTALNDVKLNQKKRIAAPQKAALLQHLPILQRHFNSAIIHQLPFIPVTPTFESISTQFAFQDGVVAGKMFGMPCLYVNGNAFLGYFKEKMVFKLTGLDHQEALSLTEAELFDPGDYGRPMKEWVLVPFEYADKWPQLAQAAFHYMSQAPAKVKKQK
jgi:hypothetical protein